MVKLVKANPLQLKRPEEDLFDERPSSVKKLVVTNREFLRNYKALKKQLMGKKVDKIEVLADEDHIFEVTIKKKERRKTPFEMSLELIEKYDFSYLKRPEADLFDYL